MARIQDHVVDLEEFHGYGAIHVADLEEFHGHGVLRPCPAVRALHFQVPTSLAAIDPILPGSLQGHRNWTTRVCK
jgi:hypothetical protein